MLATVKARPGSTWPSFTTCVPADLDGVCARQPTRCQDVANTPDVTCNTRSDRGQYCTSVGGQSSNPVDNNDPYSEHDFGAFEHAGERFFFKIDTYADASLTYGAEDPLGPGAVRVLTLMLASDY